jgi:hypothetical protein
MQDALLNRSLRLTIVGTIAVMGMASLILGYLGLFDLLRTDWPAAGAKIAWAAAAAMGSLLLIRYRSDLIDD